MLFVIESEEDEEYEKGYGDAGDMFLVEFLLCFVFCAAFSHSEMFLVVIPRRRSRWCQ